MSTRKKWRTFWRGWCTHRHTSKAAAYRWVDERAKDWAAGMWSTPLITVQVDEGDGWKTYERLDLREHAAAKQSQ